MDLFEQQLQDSLKRDAPLAVRMRPRTLEEFIGQEEVVGEGTLLRNAIENDLLQTAIFWGPPGSGKTTLARIIANLTKAHFQQISAVTSGVGEVRKIISEAAERKSLYGTRTILFIDEIHRFNKAQQDALLPAVEDGVIILVGATTENPYFEVNSALVSRSKIFRLRPLSAEEIHEIIRTALQDRERGLGELGLEVEENALNHIINLAGGDARVALNTLEAASLLIEEGKEKKITLEIAERAAQHKALLYDKWGDGHYDTISAFIKSMRGSDPHASLYWLARMIYAGEDPRFIARRMLIFASEDIGLADSRALLLAEAAARGVEYVGLPEARIILAHAAIYLSLAPKSNSVIQGIDGAMRDVERVESAQVPPHLRDSHYPGAKKLGHGVDYRYPHNYPDHYVEQDYLPENLKGREYYRPSSSGQEVRMADEWKRRTRRGDQFNGEADKY